MSETDEQLIAEGELGSREETPLGEGYVCPECEKRFGSRTTLWRHRQSEHGQTAAPRRPRQRSGGGESHKRGAAEINRMRRELKKGVSALTLLPFMARGTADRLMDPRVTGLIDDKAESFADAWVAVAEQNEWVRRNLTTVMQGGVWLNAAANTLALGYVVSVFAGAVPMHPGAMMLLPEMAPFFQQQPAGQNGGQPATGEAA